MKKLLWLDDIRNPFLADWLMLYAPPFAYGEGETIWVKSYSEFVDWIKTNGLPDMIAFDHDLADVRPMQGSDLVLTNDFEKEKTGFDCAKWLVEYCIKNKVELPRWVVQSANPIGRDNINGLLNNYIKHCN